MRQTGLESTVTENCSIGKQDTNVTRRPSYILEWKVRRHLVPLTIQDSLYGSLHLGNLQAKGVGAH
jgi:hypothetical protein